MYNHNFIEQKWRNYWNDHKVYKTTDNHNKKFYALDMFPYPSGSGLHVGHPKGYTTTDVISRYKKLNGFDVLHPMGWDAFGLPAEQYALKTNNHPNDFTIKNIVTFKNQLQSLGFSFDFDKEVNTTDPEYYRWTQWIFSQLYKRGLAKVQEVDVNWCEKLGTVLANEELILIDGKMYSERGEHPVVKKPMKQWVLKITEYADRLLKGLDNVDWPESLKSLQRNWIGKQEGYIFDIEGLEIFSTNIKEIENATYILISPEHPNLFEITEQNQFESVKNFIEKAKNKTDLDRTQLNKNRTGVFVGKIVVNPVNGAKIPVFVADHILMNNGTGILLGTPALNKEDWEFAKKHNIDAPGKEEKINSLTTDEIISKLSAKHQVFFKMRDWLFSRQRYWGEPFPVYYDEDDKPYIAEENELPILLPNLKEFKPSGTGESPLANAKEWLHFEKNGKKYRRETNTMPQWAGSCWYYLAYILKNENGYVPLNSPEAKKLFKKWLPVDLYIGGQEHAVLHLLYARFWHQVLFDIGVVETPEPFEKLVNQGMILGENGEKMSKSKGNVINPDSIVASHGADTLRLYEMFMGPVEASLPWNDDGVDSMRKWLDRVYRLFIERKDEIKTQANATLEKEFNIMIQKTTDQINSLRLNTAISSMMVFVNSCYKEKCVTMEMGREFAKILSCFSPHLAEEVWHQLGGKNSVTTQNWPKIDFSKMVEENVTIAISVNGKLRDTISVKKGTSKEEIFELAHASEKVKAFTSGTQVLKEIYIPNKILNIVIKK